MCSYLLSRKSPLPTHTLPSPVLCPYPRCVLQMGRLARGEARADAFLTADTAKGLIKELLEQHPKDQFDGKVGGLAGRSARQPSRNHFRARCMGWLEVVSAWRGVSVGHQRA